MPKIPFDSNEASKFYGATAKLRRGNAVLKPKVTNTQAYQAKGSKKIEEVVTHEGGGLTTGAKVVGGTAVAGGAYAANKKINKSFTSAFGVEH